MKKIVILHLFSLLYLTACTENRAYEFFKKFQDEVLPEIKDSFQVKEKDVILSSYTIGCKYPDAIEYLGYCGISIVYDYSKNTKDFEKIILKLNKNNIARISSEDKSILIINDTLPIKYESTNSYPIYNMYKYYDVEVVKGAKTLSKTGLIYYIQRYKKGVFIRDKSIFKNSFRFSEAFYKRVYEHGYCNGVTVDDATKRIVYWTVIW